MRWILKTTSISFVLTLYIFLSFYSSNNTFADDNSLKARCVDITFNQEGFSGKTPRQIYEYLNSLDTDADIEALIQKPSIANPWFRMKVPHYHHRMMGMYESIFRTLSFYGLHTELKPNRNSWMEKAIQFYSPEGLERLRGLNPHPSIMGAVKTPDQLKQIILKPRKYDESGLGTIFKKYPFLATLACSSLQATQLFQCTSAIKYAFKNMYEYGDTYNLGNGWLVDVLLSDIAAPGAFKLNHKILNRIKDNNFKDANLIEDAYESFKGTTPNEATDKKIAETFILLSLIHGQLSWESYKIAGYIQSYNHKTLTAAYMLAMLSATMDTLVQKNSLSAQLYSLPGNVSNVCDNGKAYHSLVPWFVSKSLLRNKYSAQTAKKVPFYFDWVYQVFSTSRGRNPIQNISESYDSFRNQSHRLDLMFAGIGSIIGSNKSKGSRLELDMSLAFDHSQNKVLKKYREPFKLDPNLPELKIFLKITKIYNHRLHPSTLLMNIKNNN